MLSTAMGEVIRYHDWLSEFEDKHLVKHEIHHLSCVIFWELWTQVRRVVYTFNDPMVRRMFHHGLYLMCLRGIGREIEEKSSGREVEWTWQT